MPKLSIIIPIYNTQDYLTRCLNTVLSQSENDIEVICVDDGSTDNSREVVKVFMQKDARIKLITQTNSGLGAARNAGIAAAQSPWIAFVDSDDYVHKDFCKAALDFGQKNKLDIVVFDFFSDMDGSIQSVGALPHGNIIIGQPSAWNKIYKKHCWNSHTFPNRIIYEDLSIIPYLVAVYKTGHLQIPLYYYYKRTDSIMQSRSALAKHLDIITATRQLFETCKTDPEFATIHWEEIHFLAIEHLLLAGFSRIRRSTSKEKKSQYYNKISKAFLDLVPKYMANTYYKRQSAYFKCKVFAYSSGLASHIL